jgi:TetR/AcrR family transcriptional repressor of nem operon
MARPKAFDLDTVLDHAVNAFWSKGFEATSVQDLVDSTGLGRGSLYKAFENKEKLFRDALRRYDMVWTGRQEDVLAGAGTVQDRIRTLLMAVVDEETTLGAPRGCLAVNAAIEVADHDTAVRDLVRGVFERMENALCAAIEAAQRAGEMTATDPARDLALYVLNNMYGLRVLGKTAPRAALVNIVDMVVRVL